MNQIIAFLKIDAPIQSAIEEATKIEDYLSLAIYNLLHCPPVEKAFPELKKRVLPLIRQPSLPETTLHDFEPLFTLIEVEEKRSLPLQIAKAIYEAKKSLEEKIKIKKLTLSDYLFIRKFLIAYDKFYRINPAEFEGVTNFIKKWFEIDTLKLLNQLDEKFISKHCKKIGKRGRILSYIDSKVLKCAFSLLRERDPLNNNNNDDLDSVIMHQNKFLASRSQQELFEASLNIINLNINVRQTTKLIAFLVLSKFSRETPKFFEKFALEYADELKNLVLLKPSSPDWYDYPTGTLVC